MNPDAYLEMAETEARHWWFTGRRCVLASVIGKFGLPANAKILEIGAGTGGNLTMLSSFGTVSALEVDDTARAIAAKKTGGRFDIRDGYCPTNIPFGVEKFDLVCLLDVLEHIEDDIETLVAAKRLLTGGGRVLITVPAHRWLWSSHDEFLHHKRRYSAVELRTKVAAAGLLPERISYCNTLLFPLAAAVRMKERLFKGSSHSGRSVPPGPVNRVLAAIFGAERFLLDMGNLPYGVSLLAVLRAP